MRNGITQRKKFERKFVDGLIVKVQDMYCKTSDVVDRENRNDGPIRSVRLDTIPPPPPFTYMMTKGYHVELVVKGRILDIVTPSMFNVLNMNSRYIQRVENNFYYLLSQLPNY